MSKEPFAPLSNKPKTISTTTLGVMVTGGVALGVAGAFLGDITSGANLIINMAGGAIGGAITGGIVAVTTSIMGGSPAVEKTFESIKKTGAEYAKRALQNKYVQQAIREIIKIETRLLIKELKKPKTREVIKNEIRKELIKDVEEKKLKIRRALIKNKNEVTQSLRNTPLKINLLIKDALKKSRNPNTAKKIEDDIQTINQAFTNLPERNAQIIQETKTRFTPTSQEEILIVFNNSTQQINSSITNLPETIKNAEKIVTKEVIDAFKTLPQDFQKTKAQIVQKSKKVTKKAEEVSKKVEKDLTKTGKKIENFFRR